MRLGWIVANTAVNIASTRYRCYYPAIALAERGVESQVFMASQEAHADLSQLDALIFVKRLDANSVRLAMEARALGKRVYVDLCDNVVIPNYERDLRSHQIPWLCALSVLADAVVTTNAALTESLMPVLSAQAKFCEIPDQIETRASVEAATLFSKPFRRVQLPVSRISSLRASVRPLVRTVLRDPSGAMQVLQRKLTESIQRRRAFHKSSSVSSKSEPRSTTGKIVLWFGNYGSPYSDFGMLTLLRAAHALEKVAREIDFELLVVSNNRTMFQNCIAPLPLRTRYVEWSPDAVFDALDVASTCLLPSGRDAFSLAKSANRAVMALHHGVPVISSRMRSLEPLMPSIVLDDWEMGLRRFLGSENERRIAVSAARPILDELYTPQAVAESWMRLLDQHQPHCGRIRRPNRRKTDIGVVLDLVQDLDVLLPVIDEVRQHEAANLRVIITDAISKRSPRALRALQERQIIPYYVERKYALASDTRAVGGLDCLLTASETTLAAHQTCHALVVGAQKLGVTTFTLQHGLENVGLTYFDDKHGHDVAFASDYILTWLSQDKLPSALRPETRAKCNAVGRTNPAHVATLPKPVEWGAKTAIGVFENLHWERYSPAYRSAFVRDLLHLAESRDDVVLIVKPHHAGRYLAKEGSLLDKAPSNVFMLDPQDQRWERFTAGAVLPHCSAVITTPSSVALDAAELDIPVAVAVYNLKAPAYEPLQTLRNFSQWQMFVDQALSKDPMLFHTLQKFRDNARIPGDASKRITEFMLTRCGTANSASHQTARRYEVFRAK